MAHLLKRAEAQWPAWASRPLAAVRVKVVSLRPRVLEIDPDPDAPIVLIRTDTLLALLPKDVVVQSPDGDVCPAHGRFFITTESFDPYHLLIDDHQGVVR